MIDGIEVKQLKRHADERGYLMEMYRTDWDIYGKFAQAYVSMSYPDVIRAWHYHKKQDDIWVVVKGMVKAVVYDCRQDSPTKGEVNEFFLGDNNPIMLKIPADTMHGYKTIGTEPSLLINFPSELYNPKEPDEFR
ncbi:MAG: dTDP-4-dehydrorhamnose 3,5-epimerase family protein, partial [Armatimonadetes bacterium]|nr:dTDP-4-dehydrorhamnose 3,5-epimerase family protein [Armatimonadota bacterium]